MLKKSTQIIEGNDPKWTEIVSKCNAYDFYHTRCYHALESKNRAVLVVANLADDFVALPLIIREIENSTYFDCTSVYGYGGPISNLPFHKIVKEHIEYFQKEVWHFFKSNNIVSAFTRLHPLINNQNLFLNFGEIMDLNQTVAINLKLTEEEQKKQYRKSIKYEITQLQKKGYNVTEAETADEVEAFIEIYSKTMKRVAAKDDYYFKPDYFYKFLNNDCFTSKILIAKVNGEITAGAMFTISNQIMQYHLAGTAEKFIKDAPMKLILEEARILGKKLNLDVLNLGGGLTTSAEDSLYRFKSGFSTYQNTFQTWQLIVDINQYNKLVVEKEIDENSNFFPLYRVKKKKKPKLYIFGASGHAKVIIDMLLLLKQEIITIFDDNPKADTLFDIPIINFNDIKYLDPNNQLILAVGDNAIRKRLANRWKGNYATIIHPTAVIASNVEIQQGTVIMASAIVNTGAKIGQQVIINSGALVEHDCIISDFAHISPKAALAGNVTVGEGAQVGINACVRQGIKIGKWAIVGAGAVIVKDVPDFAVVVGNPGKILRYTNQN